EAQKIARAEVDALGKAPTDNGDLDKLRYVEACVLETLRMNNSTPGPLPHVTVEHCVIEGKSVDPGTVLIMMTGEAMKSEEHFDDIHFTIGYDNVDEMTFINHVAVNLQLSMKARTV
ncbi:hypothetical protein FOZ63_032491, partial [Perkinsus olseni]